jgi:hypothetical protein
MFTTEVARMDDLVLPFANSFEIKITQDKVLKSIEKALSLIHLKVQTIAVSCF